MRHLRAFAALAEERHFGRAANSLHLAQPALSQQIKQLERELGTALFTRTTRRVEFTQAGARFADHARRVLSAVERAREDMETLASGRAGRVSIGFVGTATYEVLPRVAREVSRLLPGVQLELRGEVLSPDLMDALVDRSHDLAVLRPDHVQRPDVVVQPLRKERLVAVLPSEHRLAKRKRIQLVELARESFVMHPSGTRSSMHEQVLRACADAGFEPVRVTEVGETATMVVFVAAGLGVALVPEPVRSLGLDGVAYVELTAAPTVELALAYRLDDMSPVASRVAAIVEAAACD